MPELAGPAVAAGRLAQQQQPTLEVDGLTIRPWRMSDIPAVVDAYQDPAIQHWHARTMTHLEARNWVTSWSERWRAETGAGWAVTSNEVLLGRVGFRRICLPEGWAEAAYWTVPAARGRKVAPRALGLCPAGCSRLSACIASS